MQYFQYPCIQYIPGANLLFDHIETSLRQVSRCAERLFCGYIHGFSFSAFLSAFMGTAMVRKHINAESGKLLCSTDAKSVPIVISQYRLSRCDRFLEHQLAAQAIGQCFGNQDVNKLALQARMSVKIDDAIVFCAPAHLQLTLAGLAVD
jgi:hypothetical protein